MASHALLPGFVFHQELGMRKVSQDCQPYWLGCGAGKELIIPRTLSLGPQHCKESWNPMSPLLLNNHNVKSDPAVKRPVLINLKDAHPDSVLFSSGIAEHCTKHEKILQFLMSGSREGEKGVLDASLLLDLFGLQNLTANLHQFASSDFGFHHHGLGTGPSLCYPPNEFCAQAQRHLWDFAGDLACRSKINIDTVSQILYKGSSIEMKDRAPIVVEFCLLKNSTKRVKQSLLVPQFSRLDSCKALSALKTLDPMKVAPVKSFEKVKLKPSQKKNSRKAGQGRDLYGNNYFHACESLLSLMVDTRLRGEKMTVSLKKSGPELPQLLTQFSVGIAGAGLVTIFSSVYKVACGSVPFCTTKLFNTWFGFGLVWLSGAVNNLRDAIVQIGKGKSSRKLSLKEEEMMKKVDQRVNEIFFRAVVVLAVAALRLA